VKIDATVNQVRALLQLAMLNNEGKDRVSPETYGWGHKAAQRGLPRILLQRYYSLTDAGRTPAVVAIERGACSGCHVRLPTMVEYVAHRSPAVHICPHCRRILYAPEIVREDSRVGGGKPSRAAPVSTARRS